MDTIFTMKTSFCVGFFFSLAIDRGFQCTRVCHVWSYRMLKFELSRAGSRSTWRELDVKVVDVFSWLTCVLCAGIWSVGFSHYLPLHLWYVKHESIEMTSTVGWCEWENFTLYQSNELVCKIEGGFGVHAWGRRPTVSLSERSQPLN